MLNPANQAKIQARKQGLSYWEYMAKIHPSIVQKFVWGVKKVTRKQEREENNEILSSMAISSNPRLRILAQMRAILGGNSHY